MQSNGSVERLLDFIRQSKVRDVQSFVRHNSNLSAEDVARVRQAAETTERSWRCDYGAFGMITYFSLLSSGYFGFLGAMYALMKDIDPGVVLSAAKIYAKNSAKRVSHVSFALSYVRHYGVRALNSVKNGFKRGCFIAASICLLPGLLGAAGLGAESIYVYFGKRRASSVRSFINNSFSENHV